MKKYEYFEHTADVGIIAYGNSENELFGNAATAMTEQMVDLRDVREKVSRSITMEARNIENLLYDFLSELVFLKDTENILFLKFKVNIEKKGKGLLLNALLKGEKINMKTQELRTDVKAVTMHKFKVEKVEGGHKATFVLDI